VRFTRRGSPRKARDWAGVPASEERAAIVTDAKTSSRWPLTFHAERREAHSAARTHRRSKLKFRTRGADDRTRTTASLPCPNPFP
jgi:hypothetical protein